MLSALLIADNPRLADYVSRTCTAGNILIEKSSSYPSTYSLGRLLGLHAPEAVFVEVGGPETHGEFERVLIEIRGMLPAAAVVPIAWNPGPAAAQITERLGLVPPLAPPFSIDDLEAAILSALGRAGDRTSARLVLFVPARQGSGATTIALNAAHRLSTAGGYRTLLIELDDNDGALSAILPSSPEPVAAETNHFSAFSIRQHVQNIGELEIVSGRRLAAITGLNPWRVRRFILAAQSHYDYVLVRAPRLSHPGLSAVLPSVTRAVVVATPDLASMSVAKSMTSGLAAARCDVSVVVNRSSDGEVRKQAALFHAAAVNTVPEASALLRKAQLSHFGVVAADGPFLRSVTKVASAVAGSPLRGRASAYKFTLGFFSKVFTPAEV